MAASLRSRLLIGGLLLLTMMSLGYNAIWIASVPAIEQVSCLSHFAQVHAAAIESREAAQWERAAYLYAYLMEYSPQAPHGCMSRPPQMYGWATPAVTLAWRWKFSQVPNTERVAARDAEEFERRYAEAARELGLSVQTARRD